MEINDKKRKGEDLEHDHTKKQRFSGNTNDLNYLELLPREILHALAQYAGAYPFVLLSLTCKSFYDLLSKHNKFWYSLYRGERLVNSTAVDLDNSSLREELVNLGFTDDDQIWEKYDDDLTTDTANIQQQLTSDDYYMKYVPKTEGQEDQPITYKDDIDYKELAVEEWLKRQHFEIWNDTACSSLYKPTCKCCTKDTDLALYGEDGGELWVKDPESESGLGSHDSSSESLSDDESSEENSAASDSESDSSEAEEDDDEIEPVMLTAELRDKIIASVAESPQLKIFVQVLDAAVLGHIPPSTCPDTEELAIMKLNHSVVYLGNVVDEVLEQISLAVNLDAQSCHKMLFCALQKLCIADLLYLDQEVKARFPYLANVFSVHNVERSVPLTWHDIVGNNEPHWAFSFHAAMASEDELDALPDWLSLRHSILRLMRNCVLNATPSTPDHAMNELVEFIRKILQNIIEEKNASEDTPSVNVAELDVLKAVCRVPTGALRFVTPHTMYLTSKLMRESMVHLRSDSECSYPSSYSDESAEEEDLNQFVEENKKNILNRPQTPKKDSNDPLQQQNDEAEVDSVEEDLTDHQELTAQIKNTTQILDDTSSLLMRTAVVYGQTDLTAEQLNHLSGEAFSESDEEVEDNLNAWLRVDDDTYNPDYVEKMIHNIKQDAAYYAGNGEAGDQAEEQISFIDSKVPDELPDLRQDLSEEQRTKILAVRRETNRLLKEEAMREHSEFLVKKFDRLHNNYTKYHKSSSVQGRSLEIKFFTDNEKNIKRAVNEAIELIGKSGELETVKISDHQDDEPVNNEYITPIEELFGAIQNSPSINTVKLYSCNFQNLVPLIQLLQCNKLERFHWVFTRSAVLPILEELSKQTSLKELAIDYPIHTGPRPYVHDALLPLIPSLQVLKLVLPWNSTSQAPLEHLETLMPKCSSLKRVVLCFNRFDLYKAPTEYVTRMFNAITEAAKPAEVHIIGSTHMNSC